MTSGSGRRDAPREWRRSGNPCGVCDRRKRLVAARCRRRAAPDVDALHRVGDRQGGHRTVAASQRRIDDAVDQVAADEGAGGVVDQHEVRLRAPPAPPGPLRTDSCRVAPPAIGSASSFGRPRDGLLVERRGRRDAITTSDGADRAGVERSASSVRRRIGLPPSAAILLRHARARALSPRPAATTRATILLEATDVMSACGIPAGCALYSIALDKARGPLAAIPANDYPVCRYSR